MAVSRRRGATLDRDTARARAHRQGDLIPCRRVLDLAHIQRRGARAGVAFLYEREIDPILKSVIPFGVRSARRTRPRPAICWPIIRTAGPPCPGPLSRPGNGPTSFASDTDPTTASRTVSMIISTGACPVRVSISAMPPLDLGHVAGGRLHALGHVVNEQPIIDLGALCRS